MAQNDNSELIDRFGRRIDYVRLSITDRCDFRCVYCMAEEMTFLPRRDILSLEEIARLAQTFVALGVKKIRITGGEPLVRKGVLGLLRTIAGLSGLQELVLTTNGNHLAEMAKDLKAAGVQRINISLDTLDPNKFKQLTRNGDLARVLQGIEVARAVGFKRLKINSVILKEHNYQEIPQLVRFAVERGIDISFIEEMPLGVVDNHSRAGSFYPGHLLRQSLVPHFDLQPSTHTTGGPAQYYHVAGSDTFIGFITPHSANFCSTCNRLRVTVEGRLLLCLGNEHAVDLKAVLRDFPQDSQQLRAIIIAALALKPEKHTFEVQAQPVILRHMSVTGG